MSGVKKPGFTFWWKVENFSMLPHQKGEDLLSPKFVVEPWKEFEWNLQLYPRGHSRKESEGYVSLFFNKTQDDVEMEITYALTFELADTSSEILIEEKVATTAGRGRDRYISQKDFNAEKHLYAPQDILTIRFQLQLPDKTTAESEVLQPTPICEPESTSNVSRKSCTYRSGIQVQQRSITWTINSIKTHTDRIDTYLSDVDKHSPNLKVSLIFCESKNNICVPIEIQQTGLTSLVEETERLFVKFRVTVVSNNEGYRDSEESTHLFELDIEDVWRFPLFLKTDNLTRDKYLDVEETLQLQFDFAFTNKNAVYHWDTDTKYSSVGCRNKPQVSEWCRSLQSQFATFDLSDVTLETAGETFPSYRNVLAAHSTVFKAMFQNDMKEKTTGLVKIEDADPKVLKMMLTYMHSGDLDEELSPEDAGDLYRAADKYNIVPLSEADMFSISGVLSVCRQCVRCPTPC